MRADVPEDWGDQKISAVALKLYDAVFLLGPRIEFGAWWGKFFKDTDRFVAMRTWERWKADFRAAGIEFDLVEEWGDGGNHGVHTIVFQSTAYAMAMVDALIGPADPELTGAETVNVYQLFPEDTHEDVEWLIEELAKEVQE